MYLIYLHLYFFFFLNDTATTEIYTLSLHDALPISPYLEAGGTDGMIYRTKGIPTFASSRSEEHTSELQSRLHLVCRLLLEKKKNKNTKTPLLQSSILQIPPVLSMTQSCLRLITSSS